MLVKSKDANENYLAKVIKIEESDWKPHPNADKLKMVTVDFQNVITGLDAPAGYYVYFPVESKINAEYLSKSNSFSDSELNADKTQKGFFNKHGRVRAISLRSEPSQGYLVPFSTLSSDDPEKYLNGYYDTFDNVLMVEKYVPFGNIKGSGVKAKEGKTPKVSRLIDGQFRLHLDTENFRKNYHKISGFDIVNFSYKLHGTSCVVGNVLCKKELTWKEKVAKFFGVAVEETEYDIIWSSRKVIKNSSVGGYYGKEDIWGVVKEEIKDKIPKGFTLYLEIVGYLPSGGAIQGGYDYGCKAGEHESYVYRITFTNQDGQVFELSTAQIEEFCSKQGLKTPMVFYTGNIDTRKDDLIPELEAEYNNKNCFMCTKKVPEEGIVIRKESLFGFEAYKLKSSKFLEWESKQLDEATEVLD